MIRFTLVAALASLSSALVAAEPAGVEQPVTQFVQIENEPPAELFVDQPLEGPLARGAVIIPYRTRHFRILPVFGTNALDVSPRTGHLHVSVDDLPWRWADAGGNGAVVVNGLPAGPHKILIELATPVHGVLTGKTVSFVIPTVPGTAAAAK